jgi:hypothetical protein
MLEGYFGIDYTDEQKKRLLAVQAALEIAKSGAAGEGSAVALSKTEHYVAKCADAIQAALENK